MSKIQAFGSIISDDRISDCRIEIFGQSRIVIEGCYGIKEYDSDVIQINMPKNTLIVVGTSLDIVNMGDRSITVHGKIISLEFEGINV